MGGREENIGNLSRPFRISATHGNYEVVMSEATSLLWVAGGGALGAWCRFQVSAWFADWFGKGFPYGTLFVNVVGSFIMGAIVAGIKAGYFPFAPWHDFIAEGFLGALTTFSTFSMDTFKLYAKGDMLNGTLNLLLNMIFCLAGVTLGVYMMI